MSAPHLNYRNFSRFEPEIAAFLAKAPNPWRVEGTKYGLQPSSLAARLRDAIASYKYHRWANTPFAPTVFTTWEKGMRVVNTINGVFIVDATEYANSTLANRPPSDPGSIASGTEVRINFTRLPENLHGSILTHLAILCHYKVLDQVILISAPEKLLPPLLNLYDIAVVDRDDGSKLMV